MKKVIDTIKEILTKDASTQTEPVTIIETQEEDMSKTTQNALTEGQTIGLDNLSGFIQKRGEYAVEIRKAKRDNYLKKKRSPQDDKFLSGGDQTEEIMKEEIDAEQQPVIPADASFYDKCENYVATIYPEEIDSSDLYSGIAGTLILPIDEYPSFNLGEFMRLMKNIFIEATDIDYSESTNEEVRDMLALQVAGVCTVCRDNQDYINGLVASNNLAAAQEVEFNTDLLKRTIIGYLTELTNQELAGEVLNILENTN